MKMVIAVIKPHKLDDVRKALNEIGVQGMTVTDVRGYGRQKGKTEMYEGAEAVTAFIEKTKIDICVDNSMVDQVVDTVISAAGNNKIGDGKIFVYEVEQVIRIRTGERGAAAI